MRVCEAGQRRVKPTLTRNGEEKEVRGDYVGIARVAIDMVRMT